MPKYRGVTKKYNKYYYYIYHQGKVIWSRGYETALEVSEEREKARQELKKKKVADLREIAKDIDHEVLHGYTTMHKNDLLMALCTALKVEAHEHHDVVGINKRAIKAEIRQLKTQRDGLLQARDRTELKKIRRKMHHLKRRIREATI